MKRNELHQENQFCRAVRCTLASSKRAAASSDKRSVFLSVCRCISPLFFPCAPTILKIPFSKHALHHPLPISFRRVPSSNILSQTHLHLISEPLALIIYYYIHDFFIPSLFLLQTPPNPAVLQTNQSHPHTLPVLPLQNRTVQK